MSDYGKPGSALTKRGLEDAPPPYPSPDPRTPDCTHGWTGKWGKVGERQQKCRHCERWIWDHEMPSPESLGVGDAARLTSEL